MHETSALPGGLWEGDELRSAFAFRPLDGALELALGEVALDASSTPVAVTRALCLALESLADASPTADRVDALCVSDRQFLMRELQQRRGDSQRWLSAACVACATRFDFQVDLAALPVQRAGATFPFAEGEWRGRRWRARLPTGADQAWLAREPHGSEAELGVSLLRRLLQAGEAADGPPTDQGAVTDPELLAQVDVALDAIAPAVVVQLAAPCPECGQINAVPVDPYATLDRGIAPLLQDVHALASRYHWSEHDILRLPQSRRQFYLALIANHDFPE